MDHSFNINVAKKLGIASAVILNNLYWWIDKNRAKEGDLSSGFDGFEIETQEIYEKDEYIQLMAEKNSSLEEQATDLQLALADVYEQMLGLSAN